MSMMVLSVRCMQNLSQYDDYLNCRSYVFIKRCLTIGVVNLLSMIIIITKTVDSHYFSDAAYCDTYVSLML